jgi:hypothetical protein
MRQRALARAVGSHDRVRFAGANGQRHAAQHRLLGNADVQISHFE